MIKSAISTKNTLYSPRYPQKTTLKVVNQLRTGDLRKTDKKDPEAEAERLNKLAAKAPFCIIHKARKFDIL
ncbi:hypothetical protein Q4E93_07305 [Flavitalea sp. BT771]|uniref:hypothetical protein n=1 Tax=Flavitalea sp. BT771 TaxID=3063329 RepID=UPI0026E2F382|nr:hypothetical protein [Flavitalea sp. BT771]MDO6430386.1 hypothetical protein [Flavitalea sp. BT771]MDV6219474.1 hypothetical protein [Flavitalea sp. BT771]